MGLILSIETATKVCSVALHKDGTLLTCSEIHLDKSHSTYLLGLIEHVLRVADMDQKDLQAIAISEGPGSYTGLRIGSSTVKGLCYALDTPLISVSTLQAMALQVSNLYTENAIFCPMIDASRMEVYCALYDVNNKVVKEIEPVIIDESSFLDEMVSNKMIFFGNGSDKCKGVISDQAAFVSGIFPSAVTIGQIAFEKYEEKKFEDIAYYEPFYLKEFRPTTPKAKLL